MTSEADKQKALKYAQHDLHIDDVSERDILYIKSNAVRSYVCNKEVCTTRIIVDEFMNYLVTKGFRITKKETK